MAVTDYLKINDSSPTIDEASLVSDSMKDAFFEWLSNGNAKNYRQSLA